MSGQSTPTPRDPRHVDVDAALLTSRYGAHVGFVSTPKYFDDVVREFLKVAPTGTGVIQCVLSPDGYSYDLEQRVAALPEMAHAARALAESFCDVVVQVGTNWVHAGGRTPDDVSATIDRLSRDLGVPFLMAGQCIVDALRHVGAQRIAVANSYYRDDWRDGINRYLTQAGFELVGSGSIMDQGIVSSLDEALAIERATLWNYPDAIVREAITRTHRAAPDVDAVVQTGAGFRTIELLERIEHDIGVPVIASDAAAFWGCLRTLGLGADPGFGSLLDSTRG